MDLGLARSDFLTGRQVSTFPEPKAASRRTRMPLELSCPYCSKAMKLADSAAGLIVKCPRCKNRLKVDPGQSGSSGFEESFQVVEDWACPCCKAALALGAIVCVRCGYDFETRQRPEMQRRSDDAFEIVGSQFLGTYTEFIVRRDAFEGWLLFVDSREHSVSTGYAKFVLSEYEQAWVNYFQVSPDSGSMNLDLIDREGLSYRVFSGDSSAMEWLIGHLRDAGIDIKRI
jgi:hypothetical protein